MGLFTRKRTSDDELKQVILLRADLKLPKGKAAAQAAHASVEAVLRSETATVDAWHANGMKKVVVKAADEAELLRIQREAKAKKLVASIITDAGKTVVAPGTRTALAIGPDSETAIDAVTKDLPLY